MKDIIVILASADGISVIALTAAEFDAELNEEGSGLQPEDVTYLDGIPDSQDPNHWQAEGNKHAVALVIAGGRVVCPTVATEVTRWKGGAG